MPYLIPSFHRPTFLFPKKGSQAIWMASSLHAEMHCSSLPQVSGRTRAATPSAIAKDLGPHASTHKPQPVHRSSRTMGIHLSATRNTSACPHQLGSTTQGARGSQGHLRRGEAALAMT